MDGEDRLKKKKIACLILLLLFCLPITVLKTENVYAGYAEGDDGGGYSDTTINYDCTGSRGWSRCPQWIKVSKSIYDGIINNGRIDGTYSGLNQCKSDSYTIIAGYIKNSTGTLYIRNLSRDISPDKVSHILVGTATSSTNVNVTINSSWSAETAWPPRRGFFSEKAGTYHGEDITYGKLMSLIMKQNNVSERRLAAFCMSMLKEEDTFQGKVEVSGSASGSIGYTRNNETKTVTISNCSPINGCNIKFSNYIKRTAGEGKTSYSIARTSNLTSRVSADSSVKSGTSGNSNGEKLTDDPTSGTYKLYPGMVVCEILSFKVSPDDKNDKKVTLCASALGNAQPTGSDDNALLKIKVKNERISNNFQSEVYARPGDNLAYKTTYNPILQYTYNLKAQQMRINGGTIYPANDTNTATKLGDLFNANNGNLADWNNAFSVQKGFNNDYKWLVQFDGNNYVKLSLGATTRTEKENRVLVNSSDVGKIINERAITNLNKDTQTTPSQVTFTNNNDRNLGNVITSSINSVASAKVPYNFINSIDFKEEDELDKTAEFYAGESKLIRGLEIKVSPRENKTLDSIYATIVRNAQVKIALCYVSNSEEKCEEKIQNYATLNGDNEIDIFAEHTYSVNDIMMPVPDIAAGTGICIKASIYPATSGNDTNLDAGGDKQWTNPVEKCYVVAKRSSLQVWGGNIYSNGTIKTAITTKKRLIGHEDGTYTFGSWGELGIIAGGKVTGLASGAGFGYSGVGLVANPGGTTQTSFCYVSTLSFANDRCSYAEKAVGSLGTTLPLQQAGKDKNTVINKLAGLDNIGVITFVNKQGEDHTITGDIENKEQVSALEELPKTVIYAENIYIDCGVTRIDALLIAEKNVVTCNNFDNDLTNENVEKHINDRINSSQLTINGAIVAGKLIANRTYGAATGNNSIVPAEIINFDPTLYLWGKAASENEANMSLLTTYLHELSPRY